MADHIYQGLCPDDQTGPGSRDPDCPACRALDSDDAADARRYRAFFDAGLPITFLGQPYWTKADLDAAIDQAQEGGA